MKFCVQELTELRAMVLELKARAQAEDDIGKPGTDLRKV